MIESIDKNKEELEKKIIEENIKNRTGLEKKGIVIINSEFNDEMMENIFFKLDGMIKDNNTKEITIYINSNGGQVMALVPLIDLIKNSKKQINTIVLGKAYSAGAILLICGHKRKAFEHSDILIHEIAYDLGYQKNTQAKSYVKSSDYYNKILMDIIKEKTKMTVEQIKYYMDSNIDDFITTKQALKFGIIDKIIK